MTVTGEVSTRLDHVFHAALLLTGDMKTAEDAVLDGIAALNLDYDVDETLRVETVKSAIRRRADSPAHSEQALSHLPWEVRRLTRLAAVSRDCFTLRVLLGLSARSSSALLNISTQEMQELLCAAFRELPLLDESDSDVELTPHSTQTMQDPVLMRGKATTKVVTRVRCRRIGAGAARNEASDWS